MFNREQRDFQDISMAGSKVQDSGFRVSISGLMQIIFLFNGFDWSTAFVAFVSLVRLVLLVNCVSYIGFIGFICFICQFS